MGEEARRAGRGYVWAGVIGGLFLIGLVFVARHLASDTAAGTETGRPPATAAPEEALPGAAVPVTVDRVRLGEIARTVPIAGVIRAPAERQLAARSAARILTVSVREGDRVLPGQLLAELEDREARAALEVAEAGVHAAEAALTKTESALTVRGSEIKASAAGAEAALEAARARLVQSREAAEAAAAEAAAELRRAQAGLEAANASLATVTHGPRAEQRRQAESAVTQADVAAKTAHRGLEESQFLYDRGGLTRAQLEEARAADATARAQLDSARAGLDLVLQGATPEERRAAEAAVRQAEAAVETAHAGQRRAALQMRETTAAEAQVRQAEAAAQAARAGLAGRGAARADLRAAAAALEQARVQRRQAEEQVAATRLTSPVAGVVSFRAAEPGQIAQPGQTLVTIACGAPVFEAPVSVATVTMLRPGQSLTLTSDAGGGRRFQAVLSDVPTVPGPDGRTYLVRARITGVGAMHAGGEGGPARTVPPLGRARGTVEVARAAQAVLIPEAAVQRIGGATAVWIARAGKAERRAVQVGIETDTEAQALSGVVPGESVIVSGAEGLQPGDVVDAGGQRDIPPGKRSDVGGPGPWG